MRISKVLYGIMLALVLVLTYFRAQELQEENLRKVKNLAAIYAERIQNIVQGVETDIKHLEGMFQLYGDGITKKQFEDVSNIIFEESYFLVISYQPDGVVRYVYPPKPYQWFVGLNLLEHDDTKGDALYAKNSGRTIFVGPTKIINYEGIIARRPVMTEENGRKKFWGFVTIGFDVKKLLTNVIEIEALENFNLEYGVDTLYRGRYIPTLRSAGFEQEKAHKQIFTVGDQTWIFYLYDYKASNALFTQVSYFFIISFILCTGVFVIINRYEMKHHTAKKLTYMDALTKAYNRKMVDEYLEQHEGDIANGFTLFYLDLNDFKPVNDIHGHEAGDKLLIAFVERMRHNFKQGTPIVRMGGDEFALIMNTTLSEIALTSVIKRIDSLSKEKFNLDGLLVQISSSIGYAQYPQDGETMADILAKADEKMYAWKKAFKSERARNAGKES